MENCKEILPYYIRKPGMTWTCYYITQVVQVLCIIPRCVTSTLTTQVHYWLFFKAQFLVVLCQFEISFSYFKNVLRITNFFFNSRKYLGMKNWKRQLSRKDKALLLSLLSILQVLFAKSSID